MAKKPAAAPALQDRIKELRRVPGRELIANPLNYRTHPAAQRSALAGVLEKVGISAALIARETPDGLLLIDGHLRCEDYGDQDWPVLVLDVTEEEGNLLLATLDPLAALAGTSDDLLAQLMGSMDEQLQALARLTSSPAKAAAEAAKQQATGILRERFVLPPFSVLDARQGYWQERKRAWRDLGIRGEVGRGDNLPNFSEQMQHRAPAGPAKVFGNDDWVNENTNQQAPEGNGTSIFDPVLAELAYRWFCPPGGSVIDPFAGGCSRGAVAAFLGRHYTGIDLSAAQISANEAIADEMQLDPRPRWLHGDAADIATLAPGSYDMILTCPPYADLEVYSDDPRDLSVMGYPAFVESLRAIFAASVALLRDDSFVVVVVGEVRQADGFYRNLVPDTIAALEAAGARFYNEAILVTAVGTLPLRVGKQFSTTRKVGKTHQNVLVAVKGDAERAAARCSEVDKEFRHSRKLCKQHQNVLVAVKGDPRKAAERCGEVDVADPTEGFGILQGLIS